MTREGAPVFIQLLCGKEGQAAQEAIAYSPDAWEMPMEHFGFGGIPDYEF